MFFVLALAIFILAAIGLGTVFGSAVGALFLLPILLLKVAFFVFLFGFVGRSLAYRRGPPMGWWDAEWRGRTRRSRRPERRPERTEEERFEQWHREQHAREEVDSWVEDIVGPE